MTPGKFIAFEGGEGAGKSTHARMLAAALQERGIGCIITREPGGTAGAEAIRALLLDTSGEGWNPRAEALLFAAARTARRDGDAPDRIGGRDADYHARVAASFARLAEDEPERFARIDGDGTAEIVHARIMAVLSRFGVAP